MTGRAAQVPQTAGPAGKGGGWKSGALGARGSLGRNERTTRAQEGPGLYSKGSEGSWEVNKGRRALPAWTHQCPGLSQHLQLGAKGCGQAGRISCQTQLSTIPSDLQGPPL